MKQKIPAPVAIAVAIIVILVVCGALYMKYMYQPTYSVQDIAAKYKAAASKMQGPPTQRGR